MKIKIYYVIEKELENDITGDEVTTGRKELRGFTIEHGKPVKLFELNIHLDENSEDGIDEYLHQNGYDTKEIELIQL